MRQRLGNDGMQFLCLELALQVRSELRSSEVDTSEKKADFEFVAALARFKLFRATTRTTR